MAPRKSTTDMLFDGDNSAEASAPPIIPDEESGAPSKKDAAKLRIVSLQQAATLLNRDRNTIQKWLSQDCPYVTKADRSLGISWALDLAEVVRWLENRAGTTAADKFGPGEDGKTTEDEAKRRRAVANAVIAELDMVERLRSVILIDTVLDAWTKDYAEIKGRMMSLSDAVAGRVDPSIASKVRKIVDEHVRNVFDSLKTRDVIQKAA